MVLGRWQKDTDTKSWYNVLLFLSLLIIFIDIYYFILVVAGLVSVKSEADCANGELNF